MTYNFDPDRWYENELAVLRAARRQGKLTRKAFEKSVDDLEERLAEMWRRLDGSYQVLDPPLPGGPGEDHPT